MKLGGYRESSNVEDRRGFGGRGMRIGGLGVGGTLIVAVVAMLLGVDPRDVLNGSDDQTAPAPQQQTTEAHDAGKVFVSKVLASTEDVWSHLVRGYTAPHLVLFDGVTRSGCGTAQEAMGPFYCPNDQRVYLDLAFYRELSQRFHAPGEFAEAYVVAHEIGHHVQNLTGLFERTGAHRDNATSIRTELQADCLAGVWAHHAGSDYHLIESGDIESGLNAASKIGDDTLQRETQGRVVPDSFTHGSSEQRVRWFKKGVDSGDPKSCDTFEATQL